jgi:hypothetical protein
VLQLREANKQARAAQETKQTSAAKIRPDESLMLRSVWFGRSTQQSDCGLIAQANTNL